MKWFLSLAFLVCFNSTAYSQTQRYQIPSVPNFVKVTSDIYRGARPTGLQDLKKMGIKTIINLENDAKVIANEKSQAAKLGISFISSPMSAYQKQSTSQINQLLSLLRDSTRFPIFIHCHYGKDRTGLIIGLERVEAEGWAPQKAYQEMLSIGFDQKFTYLDGYYRQRTGMTR